MASRHAAGENLTSRSRTTGVLIVRWTPDSGFPFGIQEGNSRSFAPYQLRDAHAVEGLHEGIPLPLIQRQLGHSHLSTTGTDLQGIDTAQIISTVHTRRAPTMHASAGLTL